MTLEDDQRKCEAMHDAAFRLAVVVREQRKRGLLPVHGLNAVWLDSLIVEFESAYVAFVGKAIGQMEEDR